MKPDADTELRARLDRLLRDHSRADLARRTGRSRNALTRYMQGGRLPLEFGAALVREFGVNPSWLLSGEEPIYLTDVAQASSELGNELLEVMRALDNVSKVKLGSLTGNTHARALREVSDTLDRYGSLRDRLNRVSAPILSDILDKLEDAFAQRNFDRAIALEKAAVRIERFCDDRVLSRRLLDARANRMHVAQDVDEAIAAQTRLFSQTLAGSPDFAQLADSASGLVVMLVNNLYAEKSRRIARIALAHAGPDDVHTPEYTLLRLSLARADIELGEMDDVPAALELATDTLNPEEFVALQAVKYYYLLHRGILGARELAASEPKTFAAAASVLTVATLTEDIEVVALALKQARSLMNPQMPLNRRHIDRAELVLKALRGKPIGASEFLDPEFGRDPCLNFSVCVTSALLLRLTGDRRASARIQQCQEFLEAFPPARIANPSTIAQHLRNVLSGIPRDTRSPRLAEIRRKAQVLRKQRIARGFGLLRTIQD
ncbi:MAG: helix-turn-helix transcriptional regulator [Planctomycetes bacterium]|nr:helix-turn-helix transcriptional regulator [Planctomycetota bacterium]